MAMMGSPCVTAFVSPISMLLLRQRASIFTNSLVNHLWFLEVASKPHLRPNGCVAPLSRDSHPFSWIRVQHRPSVNAHIPMYAALSRSAWRLDAYLNLCKIRYVIPLGGALEPDLRF